MLVDMARLSPSQQIESAQRERAWLAALEAGDTTVRDISQLTGLSIRRVQVRLQRARENRGEEDLPSDEELKRDGIEPPWVELVSNTKPNHPHYDLVSDRLEKPPGPFRIASGTGRGLKVRHAGAGRPIEKPTKSKAKFKPKGA